MTFHDHRTPLPAAVPPAALAQPGPVTLALRAMREAVAPPIGPVTDAIRTMRAADPAFDLNPDLRALRRALADRIEADLAALDSLGGDADFEDGGDLEDGADDEMTLGWGANAGQIVLGPNTEDGEPSLGSLGGTAAGIYFASQASWAGGARDDREEENEHGTDLDAGEAGDDNGIADMGGVQEQTLRGYAGVL